MTRHEFLGLPLDCLSLEETVARVSLFVASERVHQHVVLNAGKVVSAQGDMTLASAIRSCDMVNADGMSIVWAGRLLGIPVPERVAGIDLMERLFARAAEEGWGVYLLGARAEVVERVADVECHRYPGLRVVGYRDGYWAEKDELQVVEDIAATNPDVLMVAIPSPVKEAFLWRHRERLQVPFVMGVGGSFDVVAGVTRRAPKWMQRAGLEWLYRLAQEPRRLAKRYLIGNLRFAMLVVKELCRKAGKRGRVDSAANTSITRHREL